MNTIKGMGSVQFVIWLLNGGLGIYLTAACLRGYGSLFSAFVGGACLTSFCYGYMMAGYEQMVSALLATLEKRLWQNAGTAKK